MVRRKKKMSERILGKVFGKTKEQKTSCEEFNAAQGKRIRP